MKSWTRTLLVILAVIAVLSLILSACGPIDNGNPSDNNGKGKDKDKDKGNDNALNPDKTTICHKTGSAKNPFVELTVANDAAKDGHATHEGDLIPAPEGGCPSEAN